MATHSVFDLGYIGHKALELQKLFKEYSVQPNKDGFFLFFTDYTELEINIGKIYLLYEGVTVTTNCFDAEGHFNQVLLNKLLMSLSGERYDL